MKSIRLPFRQISVNQSHVALTETIGIVNVVAELKKLAKHIGAWSLYIMYEVVFGAYAFGMTFRFWDTIINFLINILLFYAFGIYILPRFFKHKRWLMGAIATLVTLALYAAIKYIFKTGIVPIIYPEQKGIVLNIFDYLSSALWRGGYFIILGIGYWVAADLVLSERKRRELEEKKATYELALLKAEKDNKDAQLLYLKNQINPHFLFNTLNFFYGQTMRFSQEIAEGIMLLSAIMRYALQDTGSNAKAMLADEVKHIQNFIAINQLRFGHRLQICFNIEGDLSFRMIPPLLLLTFVENCFKYGDLLNAEYPVKINLLLTNNTLHFSTYNKKRSGPVEPSAGIGIDNTRKRLDLLYPGKYLFELNDTQDHYGVVLEIKI